MRLVTYVLDQQEHVGVLGGDDVVHDVTGGLGIADATDAIEQWAAVTAWYERAEAGGLPLAELDLIAPIAHPPRNVFCVGKNYLDHVGEVKGTGPDSAPDRPIVFTKPPTSVVGTGATIDPHSDLTSELDYEAELAVIIGARGRDIARGAAAAHIWGYTIINDVSARDRQRQHKQWLLGKGLDTFCPMGPVAASADEVDPEGHGRPSLDIECRVNGEVRQRGSSLDMIFDIPSLIETISAGLTLLPGDVIATGTPAGVGAGRVPPSYLRSGDEVAITITGLGTLTNRVA